MRTAYPIPSVTAEPPSSCTICLAPGPALLGARDFGYNCNDHFSGSTIFEPYGVDIRYYRCSGCGFTFTNAFDGWSAQDFKQHVYNDDYLLTDPPFMDERPQRNAQVVAGLWHRQKGRATVLDYGGGNGRFSAFLTDWGLACESTDTFYGSQQPSRPAYDIVTCFRSSSMYLMPTRLNGLPGSGSTSPRRELCS